MSTLKIKRENGKIFCPLADSWHIETPEEKVRQEYIKILVENYGYSLDQTDPYSSHRARCPNQSVDSSSDTPQKIDFVGLKSFLRCIEFCIAFSRDFSPVSPNFSPKSAKMPI